jgi:hypothetical protein
MYRPWTPAVCTRSRSRIAKIERVVVEIFLTAVEPQPMKVIFESDLVIDQALAAVRKMG